MFPIASPIRRALLVLALSVRSRDRRRHHGTQ
ncbi:hypothetical protein Rrhod_4329 [Rhodococcus rhodnii LMG 5362]|uniref:Uncharacterized protein n=1 Tax=Rhodococcus rhodnii LMG 5362 TaxID=1273125 RepID=R7WH08_9NOCA|nr:hypothetical protein Rrhod_4329 [Rhodococcus rhodnii LMG 5362]